MAPIIHCVRHAQGYHNLSPVNHAIRDPRLTTIGEQQCRDLSDSFPHHHTVDLLVASPLRRTIYTTLIGFETVLHRGIQIVALPEAQETSDVPCDTGSDPHILHQEMSGLPIDLSLVQPGWNNKTGQWAPTSDAIAARAKQARQWLKARPEKEIVLVTHGGYLHYFTEDWSDSNVYAALQEGRIDDIDWKWPGTGWANAEFRTYQFTDEDNENASLVETPSSRTRRGKTGDIPSKQEQQRLFAKAMQNWDDEGLQVPTKIEEKVGARL